MKWENFTLKGALSFYLVSVAAMMVFVWMLCVFVLRATVDAGMAALLASFVTMFIKMAADSSGYQYNSSAGSDKKDETSAKVAGALAEKVAPIMAPAVVATAAPIPWWNRMTDAERAAITAAAGIDPLDTKLAAIVSGPVKTLPDKDEIEYLVSKSLLTPERATAIQAS